MSTPDTTPPRDSVPSPEDPHFFSKYVAPESLLQWAWGGGATQPPRVSRPALRTRSTSRRPPVDERVTSSDSSGDPDA